MNSVDLVSILPIDKITVNKICSGQVVLSLAMAVKELLENSIDAGADSIQIKLENYGSESIEVIDNGCGVEEVNFQALTLKHHTSKIKDFMDLYNVETFGFRGEALSSLCSLSNVTITTQHKNAAIGATLFFDHSGTITSQIKTLRKTGTTVRLENLFSTLPIRRTEFLKNLKREFSRMTNILYAYGLQSTGVRITCTNHVSKTKFSNKHADDKVKMSTNTTVMDTRGGSLESNIASIFGIKQKQNLLKIMEILPSQQTLSEFGLENKIMEFEKFKLDGYISSCAHGCGRSTSDRQFYFVNSRPVDNLKVSKLVNDIYHQYNNRQDPFVVLNIKVSSGSYDMNVTPDKRQILLQSEKFLYAILKESLHNIFKKIPSTLVIQNVGLTSNLTLKQEDLPEMGEQLKANSKKGGDKKQLNQSRISALTEYRLTPKNSTERPGKKPEICISQQGSEIILFGSSENLDASSEKLEIEKETARNARMKVEVLESVDQTDVVVIQKHKRQLGEGFTVFDEEKIESKKMKFDKGLGEEDKIKRKTVIYPLDLTRVKKMSDRINEDIRESKNKQIKFLTEIKPQNNEKAESELKREIKKESFKQMEIIGQFNLGFIITKLGSDLFIIDQHASDEKYNYETLQASTVIQSQKLFHPETLELTPDKEELMLRHKDVFKRNGFDFLFDEDGSAKKRIRLTAIPMSKNYTFGKEDVDELLFLLEDAVEFKDLRPSRVNCMFASRACRQSVMIGTALTLQEMRKIVDHMGNIEHPWNCPHGRPTMRHLFHLGIIHLKQ